MKRGYSRSVEPRREYKGVSMAPLCACINSTVNPSFG